MPPSDDQDMMTPEQIKAFFIEQRGYWRPWTDTMLKASPQFLSQYARYAGYPARTGPLTERMVELIYVALDTSSAHLFESGLHTHMKRAIAVGATQADIFTVLHLVAVQGVANVCQATNILAELAGMNHTPALNEALSTRIEQLGAPHALSLASLARLDPGYVEVLLDFIEQGKPGGGLTQAESSLVQTALHACFTAHNPDALRQIITTALSQGVTPAELLQSIQLGAHLAVHGTALGANAYRQLSESPLRTGVHSGVSNASDTLHTP